jgi:hypothetical protein
MTVFGQKLQVLTSHILVQYLSYDTSLIFVAITKYQRQGTYKENSAAQW